MLALSTVGGAELHEGRRAVRATMGLGYHLGQRSHTSLTGNIGILGVLVKWFVMQFKVKFRFLCKMSF